MKTTADILLSNMEHHYENIFALLNAFQEASQTSNQNVQVTLKDLDGNPKVVTVNSFQNVLKELSRMDNNFKSIFNQDNISYIINGDGSLSKYQKTTLFNADYLTGFKFGENKVEAPVDVQCKIDNVSLLKKMIFPNVKMPIILDKSIYNNVIVEYYNITEGWESIPENPTKLNLEFLESQGTISYNVMEDLIEPAKERVQYFGKFTVTSVTIDGNKAVCILDKVMYTGLNVNGDNIQLKINDVLITNDGLTKYIVEEIYPFENRVILNRIAGSGVIQTGINQLYYNQVMSTDNNIIDITIEPNKKQVIFLKATSLHIVGYPSVGIKIDPDTYKILHNNQEYTINEFYARFVTNFGEYMISIINETSIPVSLGVKPAKPILNPLNVKVIQINKHLTNQTTITDLNSLNQRKSQIQNEIDYKQKEIDLIQNEISTLKYKTIEEKTTRTNNVIRLRAEINSLKQTMLTVTRDIDNNAIESGLKDAKPKYRLIAYWDIQQPIYSPNTAPQNIVKYEVQCRYLSKNSTTIDNTSFTMINENGQEVNVAVSPWNNVEMPSLNKNVGSDGTVTWEVQIEDSIDSININQASVPIQQGESVEIRVRAISEAGYPIAPLKSDWSEIIRREFPDDLTDTGLNSLIEKNNTDLLTAEFNNVLQTAGLTRHIDGQIFEGERLFKHRTEEIASGFYTNEQKIIDLFSYLKSLRGDLDTILNTNTQTSIAVEVVDWKNETYTVQNNTTLELSAGNYSDNLNLLDTTVWGSIIRKQGFIKIRNKANVPVELRTLVPGVTFDNNTAPNYFNVPVKTPSALIQNSKQVLFFRNIDITGQQEEAFKLVKPKLPDTVTFPNPAYIDDLATEDSKDIVYFDTPNNTVKICKLKDNAGTDFIAYTIEHPMYSASNQQNIASEFDRLKLFTENIKAAIYQSENTINDITGLGFNDNDFFGVGQNSCGAFLYPIIQNPTAISVIGNSTVSTLVLPQNTELLIPFVYEYRMTDRIGKVNGMNDTTINDDLSYVKKIGIDILINNEPFKFDIQVSSKLKTAVAPIENLNVSSIVGQFANEQQQILD